jgi:hypothetical protein
MFGERRLCPAQPLPDFQQLTRQLLRAFSLSASHQDRPPDGLLILLFSSNFALSLFAAGMLAIQAASFIRLSAPTYD